MGRNRWYVPDSSTLNRYLVVGGGAALGYLAVAFLLEHTFDWSPAQSSVTAFLTMLPVAYLGHKWITFQSTKAHRQEFPRFLFAAIAGVTLSAFVPWWVIECLGLDPLIGYVAACIVVPAVNYALLTGFVFLWRSHERARKH